MTSTRERAFRYVVALALAGGLGLAQPAVRLLRVPARVMEELVDAVEGREPTWTKEDRRRVLLLLGQDPRTEIRARVAQAASALMPEWSVDANRLLRELALDPEASVRSAVTRGLEALLAQVPLIERVELLCQWVTAAEVARREALARALSTAPTTPITDWVIEELSRDANQKVRLAAMRAAQQRFLENPGVYLALARERADDEDARVRKAARLLLDTA